MNGSLGRENKTQMRTAMFAVAVLCLFCMQFLAFQSSAASPVKDIQYRTENGETAWWYTIDNAVQHGITTVAHNNAGWWYVENGKVNFDYTGFAENDAGWWWIDHGKVDFTFNSVQYGNAYGETAFWLVQRGRIRTDKTSVEHNRYGWWYCKDGKADLTYNGVAHNDAGWWAVENGKVTFSFNGLSENAAGWWYCKNSKVDFSFNGVCLQDNAFYKITNGKKDLSCNGVDHCQYGWWYFRNGVIDKSFTGVSYNDAGGWYVKNGFVDFAFDGTVTQGKYRYTITDSKVTRAVQIQYDKPAAGSKVVTDVSRWNGSIDFNVMKRSGVEGVMLRAAYATDKDRNFDTYAAAAEKAGLPYGVYHFVTWHYGTNKEEARAKAKEQADFLLGVLKGKTIPGYVALDLELESWGRLLMTPAELTEVVNYYLDYLANAGYHPMLYCSVSWLEERLLADKINVPFWTAYYYDTGTTEFPSNHYGQVMRKYKDKILLWQFTDYAEGALYGCETRDIDLSYLYGPFEIDKD